MVKLKEFIVLYEKTTLQQQQQKTDFCSCIFVACFFCLNRRWCWWFLLRYTCVHIIHTENLTCAIDNISQKRTLLVTGFFGGVQWVVFYNTMYVMYILHYSFHVPFPTNFKLFFCFSSSICFCSLLSTMLNIEHEQNKMLEKRYSISSINAYTPALPTYVDVRCMSVSCILLHGV